MKNKMFKKVSAIALSAAMSLSMYASAFAADMTVYLRNNGKEIPATTQSDETITPNIELSFVVHNVDSSMSIYDALNTATRANKMLDENTSLTTSWQKGTNADGTIDQYLVSLSAATKDGKFSATNNGGNTKLYYDDDFNVIGGKYEGNAWMWCMMKGDLNSTNYPETITLSDQKCLDSNFGIILSYDYSSFLWGDTSGEAK